VFDKLDYQPIYRLVAAGLLLIHACMVLNLIPRWSVTHNEVSHIPAGLACWYSGNFELYHVNPPLPRMVATIPLLGQPIICLEALSRIQERSTERQEFRIGAFFAATNALYYHQLVCRARLAGVFWITLGGVIIWRWTSSLYGPLGGLLSLVLWTFEPTLTAHAALATPDIPATVMGLSATYAFAHFLRAGSWFHCYMAGLLLGGALLCKFTLLLLVPAWFLAWFLTRRNREVYAVHLLPHPQRLTRTFFIAFVAWLMLCTGYEFSDIGTPIRHFSFVSELFQKTARKVDNVWMRNIPCPLPAAFLRGLDTQQRDFEGRMMSYLRGEWQNHGWWYYYLYAFGVKTPLGHLMAFGLTIIFICFFRQSIHPLLWITPLLIIIIASFKTGFTQHLRYILPAYPYLIITSGVILSRPMSRFYGVYLLAIAVTISWSAWEVICTYPHLLGFFNTAVGGRYEGYRHLAESNVDWGQDWILLREWITANPDIYPLHTAIVNYIDERIYLRMQYPLPNPEMSGYAVVDTLHLTRDYRWVLDYPLIARIGTSFFVFEVRSCHDGT
jgi:hypothetical protein